MGRHGYAYSFENFGSIYENGWVIIHPERVMTGRALTAQFLPSRPDYQNYANLQAKEEGTHTPVTNYAPIIKLQEGDIYVCDGYGKIEYGTIIGSNLGNAIASSSKRGVVFNCSVRDIEGLEAIGETFNGWIRGYDPSILRRSMMCSWINTPIRIGRITIMPGDAILCNKWGISIIPPHLLQGTVIFSEFVALRDEFSFYCIRNNIFPYINEAFVVERDVYDKAFKEWLDKQELPMPREELDAYMKQRAEERAKMEAASDAKKGVSSEIDNE